MCSKISIRTKAYKFFNGNTFAPIASVCKLRERFAKYLEGSGVYKIMRISYEDV